MRPPFPPPGLYSWARLWRWQCDVMRFVFCERRRCGLHGMESRFFILVLIPLGRAQRGERRARWNEFTRGCLQIRRISSRMLMDGIWALGWSRPDSSVTTAPLTNMEFKETSASELDRPFYLIKQGALFSVFVIKVHWFFNPPVTSDFFFLFFLVTTSWNTTPLHGKASERLPLFLPHIFERFHPIVLYLFYFILYINPVAKNCDTLHTEQMLHVLSLHSERIVDYFCFHLTLLLKGAKKYRITLRLFFTRMTAFQVGKRPWWFLTGTREIHCEQKLSLASCAETFTHSKSGRVQSVWGQPQQQRACSPGGADPDWEKVGVGVGVEGV